MTGPADQPPARQAPGRYGTRLLRTLLAVLSCRRARQRAGQAAERHRHLQLVNAADWAITTAVRAGRNELATDPFAVSPIRVSVQDVIERAGHDFNLQVSLAEAAAVLRHRLIHRGYASLGVVITDAFEEGNP
jgi:hypothetical protein